MSATKRSIYMFALTILVVLLTIVTCNTAKAYADTKWDNTRGGGIVSIDTSEKYPGTEYSIKIENTNYDCTYASKVFEVKPHTRYRVTVMAKYSGYELHPDKKYDSGAILTGIDFSGGTAGYRGAQWSSLVFEFETEDNTTCEIGLWNGYYGEDCKGTAWFSNFQLYEYGEDSTWDKATGNLMVSLDESVKFPGTEYSIRAENHDYACEYVSKNFDVKPNTHYRATVMAKYSDYELMPGKTSESGAMLKGIDVSGESESYKGGQWKQLVLEFDTKSDQKTCEIGLWNGYYAADCKGTAWFSDFRLEEYSGKKLKDWNIMLVFLKNIQAPVTYKGKIYTYKDTLNNADVKYFSELVQRLYIKAPLFSDGLWGIRGIDVYSVENKITELKPYGNNDVCVDFYGESTSRELDRIIDAAKARNGREYNQIIVVAPINGDFGKEWLGLGGGSYKGIKICQLNYDSGSEAYTADDSNYHESGITHEVLHCIESISKVIDPDNFVQFHANVEEYKGVYTNSKRQKGWGSWGAYHSDYMRCKTPDGRGIHPDAFKVADPAKYKVIYGRPKAETTSKLDIQRVKVSDITTKTYTGKKIKLKPTLKDNGKTLVEGKDYTLSYKDNLLPGMGCVIITGKGNYAGNYTKTFDIIPSKAKVSATRKSNKATISWKSVKGVDHYQIWLAKKNSTKYKLVKTVGKTTSVKITAAKGDKVKIRSCKTMYPKKFYSNYSAVIKLK